MDFLMSKNSCVVKLTVKVRNLHAGSMSADIGQIQVVYPDTGGVAELFGTAEPET